MRALERVVVRSAGVPAISPASLRERLRMLHEGDALAFDRVRDEYLRDVARGAELAEHARELDVIVSVARRNMPAEPPQLRLEVSEREDLVRRLVRLQLVA